MSLALPCFRRCGAIAPKHKLFIALRNREYFAQTLSYIGPLFYRLFYFVYKLFMCSNLYIHLYSTKNNRSMICKSRVTECYASHKSFALAEVRLTQETLGMDPTLGKGFLLDMSKSANYF